MPIYDLICPNCGHRFDELVSNREQVADIPCPRCNRFGMQLQPSLFASGGLSASTSGFGGGGGCGYGGFS